MMPSYRLFKAHKNINLKVSGRQSYRKWVLSEPVFFNEADRAGNLLSGIEVKGGGKGALNDFVEN